MRPPVAAAAGWCVRSTTLASPLAATRQITTQARQRLASIVPDGATRRVSLHDGDARPIAKGRVGKPVELGHKAQITDNDDGIVLDHTVEQGNPADAPQLAPAVERVKKRTGRAPGTVTADRGYGEKRSCIDGTEGARIWTRHGVLTHNLAKIGALAA